MDPRRYDRQGRSTNATHFTDQPSAVFKASSRRCASPTGLVNLPPPSSSAAAASSTSPPLILPNREAPGSRTRATPPPPRRPATDAHRQQVPVPFAVTAPVPGSLPYPLLFNLPLPPPPRASEGPGAESPDMPLLKVGTELAIIWLMLTESLLPV
ncbi:hypothetical protein DL767_006998 [Monosporascus sp. MG133]|nr:hypothetical protein DL767_006998 [Monosporascus sp. MG133]